MAIELINIGRIANDGTGDDLREAFTKVNRSLEDLDLRIDDNTEGLNVGAGAEVFKRRNGYDLEFRTIVSGANAVVTENTNTVTVAVDPTLADRDVIADAGAMTVPARQGIRVMGEQGITTSVDQASNSLLISGNASLSTDTNPTLTSTLNGNQNDIVNIDLMTANNVASLVHNIDIRDHEGFFEDFDLGEVRGAGIRSFLDYFRYYIDIEFGTVDNPIGPDLDFGAF
jgi:hypothetical protein